MEQSRIEKRFRSACAFANSCTDESQRLLAFAGLIKELSGRENEELNIALSLAKELEQDLYDKKLISFKIEKQSDLGKIHVSTDEGAFQIQMWLLMEKVYRPKDWPVNFDYDW